MLLLLPHQCKKLGRGKCRRMTDAMIVNAKKCLSNLVQCEDIYASNDTFGNFAAALLSQITDRHKSQIDHHLINGKWRRFLQDVCVGRGAEVGSDHHLVSPPKVNELEEKLQNCTEKCDKDPSKQNVEDLECLQAI